MSNTPIPPIDLDDQADFLPLPIAMDIALQWERSCPPAPAPTRADKVAFIRGLRWAFCYHHQLAALVDRFEN